ncbi:hypothetical protein AC1031_003438 [Aphanomyces cochlioides]|nr:hypothetical protein AC1031_003438 [Aphanomyces cochlioides]
MDQLSGNYFMELKHVKFPSCDDEFRVLFSTNVTSTSFALSLVSKKSKLHWERQVNAVADVTTTSEVSAKEVISTLLEGLRALDKSNSSVSMLNCHVDVQLNSVNNHLTLFVLMGHDTDDVSAWAWTIELIPAEMRQIDFLMACVDNLNDQCDVQATKLKECHCLLAERDRKIITLEHVLSENDKKAKATVAGHELLLSAYQTAINRLGVHETLRLDVKPLSFSVESSRSVSPGAMVIWHLHEQPNVAFAFRFDAKSVIIKASGYYCVDIHSPYEAHHDGSCIALCVASVPVHVGGITFTDTMEHRVQLTHALRLSEGTMIQVTNLGKTRLQRGTRMVIYKLA